MFERAYSSLKWKSYIQYRSVVPHFFHQRHEKYNKGGGGPFVFFLFLFTDSFLIY